MAACDLSRYIDGMSLSLFEKVTELLHERRPFVLATIVSTQGSSAGKPGAHALFDGAGVIVAGWVGGGCADAFLAEAARAALRDAEPRLVSVDLSDEVLGAGLPCGGTMEVFLEPHGVAPTALIAGAGRVGEEIARVANEAGFRVVIDDPGASSDRFPTAHLLVRDDPDFRQAPLERGTYLIVATQHKGDDLLLARALESQRCRYIGLLASRHRAGLVREKLRARGLSEALIDTIRAPAGLFLGAIGPTEIALSIVSEMVAVRRNASILDPSRCADADRCDAKAR
ncbi:MAG: XdhC family protein [Planctomycetota bacterium]